MSLSEEKRSVFILVLHTHFKSVIVFDFEDGNSKVVRHLTARKRRAT